MEAEKVTLLALSYFAKENGFIFSLLQDIPAVVTTITNSEDGSIVAILHPADGEVDLGRGGPEDGPGDGH